MTRSALVAMHDHRPGGTPVWRLAEAPSSPPLRRADWRLRAGIFCFGLASTACVAAAVWHRTAPDTVIRTRVVAEGPALAGRAALSDLALRLAGTADRAATLEDDGDSLVITARDRDPAKAGDRVRSLVDVILHASVAVAAQPTVPEPVRPDEALRAEHTRLAAAADAVDGRLATASSSLTALTRDVAARMAVDRRPGRETLDKGNAALADLELQRLQLTAKYQDTYPAVLAMDAQIRNLRVFLVDEARRIEVKPAPNDGTDALLTAERDRLRAEMGQLETQRVTIAADLGGVNRQLAALPPVTAVEAVLPVVPAVLVAAATTSFAGADDRLRTIPAIAAAGLVLSALAASLGRRRRFPTGLVLEQVTTKLIAAGETRALRSRATSDKASSFPSPSHSATGSSLPDWMDPLPPGRALEDACRDCCSAARFIPLGRAMDVARVGTNIG